MAEVPEFENFKSFVLTWHGDMGDLARELWYLMKSGAPEKEAMAWLVDNFRSFEPDEGFEGEVWNWILAHEELMPKETRDYLPVYYRESFERENLVLDPKKRRSQRPR